ARSEELKAALCSQSIENDSVSSHILPYYLPNRIGSRKHIALPNRKANIEGKDINAAAHEGNRWDAACDLHVQSVTYGQRVFVRPSDNSGGCSRNPRRGGWIRDRLDNRARNRASLGEGDSRQEILQARLTSQGIPWPDRLC